MSPILQSVARWCFVPGPLAPEPFVRAVAAAGYAGIDLVPPAYWPLVADHGLAITAVEGHASIELGLNRADQHDRIEQELRARLALAEKWHIPNLVCFSGSRADQSEAEALAHTAAGLARVAPPRVKLLYDLYHMQIMEGDLIRTLRAAHAQIGHYHTAGNPGRNDLDDTQEINYPAVLRAIAATGYTGYLAHEFVPKGDPVLALQTTFALGAACL